MHVAAKNLPPKPYFDLPDELLGLEGVIEWENCERKPVQEWTGITKKMFPPSDRLNEDQLQIMVKEILKLWNAYNFHPTLPENLPPKFAYDILVDHFDKTIEWVSEGIIGIEFCSYEPENCPFPSEYCMCKDMVEDYNQFEDIGNSKELYQLNREIRFLGNKYSKKNILSALNSRKVKRIVKQISESIHNLQTNPSHESLNQMFRIDVLDDYNFPQSIEVISGISHREFPRYNHMNGYQIRKVLIVMLELLNLLKVKVRFYNGLPIELKYQYLVESWKSEPINIFHSTETDWNELSIFP